MKRPSRGFRWAAVGLALVVCVLVGLRLRLQPEPAKQPSPDVWEWIGAERDLRSIPDGPPVPGWVYVGSSGGLPQRAGARRPFVVIVPEGNEKPGAWDRIRRQFGGDSWRPVDARHLYATGDPVVTASGKWQRYSSRWWRGANPPPPTAAATK